ncbi:MAG: ATP-binding cassette domain-containing protein [Candidatus Cloacimonetes bacterium]|nr:ATP-binding cassette domain-containing protein [Candidatus Cloacimonadota bacterium]
MIRIEHITKVFGNIRAVDSVSFSIPRGEIVGFLGPNGAGKTTTLRMVTGLLQPTAGNIWINEIPLNEAPLAASRIIGYLPEQNPLYTEMLVYDYLKYIASLRLVRKQDFFTRLDHVVQKCGLEDVLAQPIGTLSKGYRQRTGLAQAIIHDPEVLLLDEPTSGLDPNQILDIRQLIREMGRAKTVVLSSHILQEVQALCDRIIIINRGRIIADAPKDELPALLDLPLQVTIEIEGEEMDVDRFLDENQDTGLEEVLPTGQSTRYTFIIQDEAEFKRRFAQYAMQQQRLIIGMQTHTPSLEDVFHRLTRRTTLAEDEVPETPKQP